MNMYKNTKYLLPTPKYIQDIVDELFRKDVERVIVNHSKLFGINPNELNVRFSDDITENIPEEVVEDWYKKIDELLQKSSGEKQLFEVTKHIVNILNKVSKNLNYGKERI